MRQCSISSYLGSQLLRHLILSVRRGTPSQEDRRAVLRLEERGGRGGLGGVVAEEDNKTSSSLTPYPKTRSTTAPVDPGGMTGPDRQYEVSQ